MLTAKLIDNIWATRKSDLLNGYKLMLVEVIGGGANEGQRLVAIDTISAGIGDRILVSLGTAARRMIGDDSVPVDAAIVGIIDEDCEF
ncbi:MAG: EutN/CcmL family microcompartment protein [Firmicutes bacterium]|nr:EutN/CcmL family microcompartment protein [Bacillota bacterium]